MTRIAPPPEGFTPKEPRDDPGFFRNTLSRILGAFVEFEPQETSLDPGSTSALDHKPDWDPAQGAGTAGLTEQQRKDLPPDLVIR